MWQWSQHPWSADWSVLKHVASPTYSTALFVEKGQFYCAKQAQIIAGNLALTILKSNFPKRREERDFRETQTNIIIAVFILKPEMLKCIYKNQPVSSHTILAWKWVPFQLHWFLWTGLITQRLVSRSGQRLTCASIQTCSFLHVPVFRTGLADMFPGLSGTKLAADKHYCSWVGFINFTVTYEIGK